LLYLLRGIGVEARDEDALLADVEHIGDDAGDLVRGLSLAVDHFRYALADAAVVDHFRETQVGEGLVAQLGSGIFGRDGALGYGFEQLVELMLVHGGPFSLLAG